MKLDENHLNQQVSWGLIEMNPPTNEQADDLSMFLKNQAPVVHNATGKEWIHRWKLCSNEARPGFACAMVIRDTEQIVSICTITPKRLWRNGRVQFWGEVGDAFTDFNYQRNGMFTDLVNANRAMAQSAGVDLIISLPDDKSQSKTPFLKKCDFSVKEDLRFSNYFAFLSTKALGARGPLSRITLIKWLFDHSFVTKISRLFLTKVFTLVSPKTPDISVKIESDFGVEFDFLWQKARIALPNAQVRDSRYLAWRFCQSPLPFKVLVARIEGKVVGYAATLTIRHVGVDTFSHTILLDWLYDKSGAEKTNSALLSATIKQAITEEADVISAVASTANVLQMPFTRLGFLRQNRQMSMVVHRNKAGQELLEELTSWHFTLSDTDAF